MSNIQVFDFQNHKIHTLLVDNEIYFRATELATILKYSNPYDAVGTHVDTDDLVKREVIDSMNRKQKVNFVNESGMYALIFGSKQDEAKKFKKWVTSEVLPTIRKTGSYSIKVNPEQKSQLINAVSQKVRRTGDNHQTIWTMVHNKFKVNSYHELLATQFDDVMKFLGGHSQNTVIDDQIKHVIHNLVWICAWFDKYEPALKILCPKMDSDIKGRFLEIKPIVGIFNDKYKINRYSITDLEYYPWDQDFHEKSKFHSYMQHKN